MKININKLKLTTQKIVTSAKLVGPFEKKGLLINKADRPE
jgi:hypothetical protein